MPLRQSFTVVAELHMKSRTPKSILISIPAAQATLTTCFANLETRDMSMEIPHWATTTAQDIERGVNDAIRTVERLADELVSVPDGRRSFDNTVLPLDEIGDVLTQASGRFGFLSQVSADPELRTAATSARGTSQCLLGGHWISRGHRSCAQGVRHARRA